MAVSLLLRTHHIIIGRGEPKGEIAGDFDRMAG